MCNCINEIQEKILTQTKTFNGEDIIGATVKGVSYPLNPTGLSKATYQEIELELTGYKRPKTISLIHTFCPFCGEKYEKEIK